jgi:putative flippase GtrA
MLDLWNGIPAERRALLLQIVRYGLVGLAVTSAQALVYWVLAEQAHVHSQIANFAGYLVAVTGGYFLHGRYTFAEADRPDSGAAHAVRGTKFVAQCTKRATTSR